MRCTLLAIVFGTLAVGGMALAHHHEHGKGRVKILSQKDITEQIDEKKTTTAESLIPGCQLSKCGLGLRAQTEVERTFNCVRNSSNSSAERICKSGSLTTGLG
jgi:hypothetical protein